MRTIKATQRHDTTGSCDTVHGLKRRGSQHPRFALSGKRFLPGGYTQPAPVRNLFLSRGKLGCCDPVRLCVGEASFRRFASRRFAALVAASIALRVDKTTTGMIAQIPTLLSTTSLAHRAGVHRSVVIRLTRDGKLSPAAQLEVTGAEPMLLFSTDRAVEVLRHAPRAGRAQQPKIKTTEPATTVATTS